MRRNFKFRLFCFFMAKERAYNPILHKRLSALIDAADWNALLSFLDSLSHSSFRSVGSILSVHILPGLDEDKYWDLFYELCRYNSKAFLVTFLKAAPARLSVGGFCLDHAGFQQVCAYWNDCQCDIDKRKFFLYVFPLLTQPEQAEVLIRSLAFQRAEDILELLLRCEMTVLGGFVLFQTLRQLEHEKELLCRCCVFLMKRGDSLSFNLVSFFKSYFDLSQLKGTFSLHLSTYQLGYVERSFDAFANMLQSM